MRIVLLRIALIVGSTGLTLATLELAARRWLPLDPYEIRPDDATAQSIFVFSPTRGHAWRPGFRGRFMHPQFGGERVEIDEHGFRVGGERSAEPPGALRVTVLGDSLTFGVGVEASETYCALLETALAARLARPVRVFNTGVSGYGTAHETVVLREVATRQRPDIVLVGFYSGNDLQETLGFALRRQWPQFDFIASLSAATVESDRPDGVNATQFSLEGESRQVLFAHPRSTLTYRLEADELPPDAELRFGTAIHPDAWRNPEADGVDFRIEADAGGATKVLFEDRVDPRQSENQRGWNPRRVSLSDYADSGVTLRFITDPGPAGRFDFDWSAWVAPRVVAASREPDDGLTTAAPALASASAEREGVLSRAFWERRSSAARLLLARGENLAVRLRLLPPKAVYNDFMMLSMKRQPPANVDAALRQTGLELAEIRRLAGEHGARALLVLLPTKLQTEPRTLRRFLESVRVDPGEYDIEQPQAAVARVAENLDLPVLDLLPEFRRAVEAGESIYFQEGHLNRNGHRIVAAAILKAIAAELDQASPVDLRASPAGPS
jgi:lysophospholipase L1-like esterase